MSQTRGPFHTPGGAGGQQNALDINGLYTAYTSVLTPGATIVDTVQLDSAHRNGISVIRAISVKASLQVVTTDPAFGLLGKILIACDPTGEIQNTVAQQYVSPMLPLPADPSLTGILWDPAVDALPPRSSGLTVFASIIPPEPVPMSGINVSMGIWILPSLIGSPITSGRWGMSVNNASYSIFYGDA